MLSVAVGHRSRAGVQRRTQLLRGKCLGVKAELPQGPLRVPEVLESDLEPQPTAWFGVLGADGLCHVQQVVPARRAHPYLHGEVVLGEELDAALCPDEFQIDLIWSLRRLGKLLDGADTRYPHGPVGSRLGGQQVALVSHGDQPDRVHRAPAW